MPGERYPRDRLAEIAVIGGIILKPEAIDNVRGLLEPDMFTSARHIIMFTALLEMRIDGKVMDVVTLFDHLKTAFSIEDIKEITPKYITEFTDGVPTAANVREYALIVRRMYYRRQIISDTKNIQELVKHQCDEKELDEAIDDAGVHFKELSTMSRPIDTSLKAIIQQTQERVANKADLIPTGHTRLDELIGGIIRREPTIIAARPSMLKTTFCADRIPYWLEAGYKVQVLSLEVTADMYIRKLISKIGRINSSGLRRHALTKQDLERFFASCSKFYNDYEGQFSVMDYTHGMKECHKIERAVRIFKPDIIILDYVQEMKTSAQYRRIEIGNHARFLKELAIDLDAALLLVSQISRLKTFRPGEKPLPSLHDLKESGELEELAELALLLYYHYNTTGAPEDVARLRVEIAKNKYGPLGMFHLFHEPRFCELKDLGSDNFTSKGVVKHE